MSEIDHTNNDPWPHAPPHRLANSGVFIVTVGTYGKKHLFNSAKKLKSLHDGLMKYAGKFSWQLEAWAIFSNHYHFVARSSMPENGQRVNLSSFLQCLHSRSASWLNKLDGSAGRKVWHNFWETRLTHQKSYLARLNYVHQNPVRHGLVPVANQYPFCSARWFEKVANPATIKTIYGFKSDRLNVLDEFEPIWLPDG